MAIFSQRIALNQEWERGAYFSKSSFFETKGLKKHRVFSFRAIDALALFSLRRRLGHSSGCRWTFDHKVGRAR